MKARNWLHDLGLPLPVVGLQSLTRPSEKAVRLRPLGILRDKQNKGERLGLSSPWFRAFFPQVRVAWPCSGISEGGLSGQTQRGQTSESDLPRGGGGQEEKEGCRQM